MSSEFDEVAKAVARNMPRRKVLKLFAGGIAASIGSALLGSAASAQPATTHSANYNLNYCEPNLNVTASSYEFNQTGFNCDFHEEEVPYKFPFWYNRSGADIFINGNFFNTMNW